MTKFAEKIIGFAKNLKEYMGRDMWLDIFVGTLAVGLLGWIRPLFCGVFIAFIVCIAVLFVKSFVKDEPVYVSDLVGCVIGFVPGIVIVLINSLV